MHEVTKRVRQAIMSKYRNPTFSVPLALREAPKRTQFKALMPESMSQFIEPLPQAGAPDPMMLGGMLGQALDMGGVPLPGDPVMQGQGLPADPAMMMGLGGAQAAGNPTPSGPTPMMAPEGMPAAPGAAQAQARVPVQAGPGVDPTQILAALFGA